MTEEQIQKFGEIQYLKGRLDELHKAYPTVLDLSRSRKLDARIQKYYNKLKSVDEVAYHLYIVETMTRKHSKERSKNEMKKLLESILEIEEIQEPIAEEIRTQIKKYLS